MRTRLEAFVLTPLAALSLPVVKRGVFVDPPILIVGAARSGTTLLLSIIGGHERIFAIQGETRALTKWYAHPFAKTRFPGRLDRIHRALLRAEVPAGVTRWCEKTPIHVRFLPEILAFWRDRVRVVHIVRDGRDVTLSRHPLRPDEYWVTPERWVADVRSGLAFRGHPSVHTLRYEDLVLAHERTLGALCDFLKIEFSDCLREWVDHTNVREADSWAEPLERTHDRSIGKWRKPEARARVEQVLRTPGVVPLLEELGYPAE